MAITTYNCTSLEGTGNNRILAVLSEGDLTDGDRAFVADADDQMLYFEYNSSSTATTETTDRPYRVRPNDYSSSGVWIELVGFDSRITWGTTNPPSASGLRDGTLYFKYTA